MHLIQPEDFQKHIFMDECGLFYAKYNGYTFRSVFQPIYQSDVNLFAFEGLVRIQSAKQQSVRPDLFFSSPDLTVIDAINLSLLCASIHLRNFAQSEHCNKTLFINASPSVFQTLSHDDIAIQVLIKLLASLNLSPTQVVYEIMEFDEGNMESIFSWIKVLNKYGIAIAMDDFGICGSNHSRAKILLPDIIKIDKSILDDFITHQSRNLEESLILSRQIGAKVIVEGIETEEQMDKISHLNIDMYQGFLLGRPQPLDPQLTH
ncbi:EAL domain-containing protein [uncultured Photobacterium sp.]|uniref:EAL domain-containing protein n=1 Tax=uncultured Photobacterium sp. TaxID=173973 RepID=UPI00260C059F|nr:EAL domain-containing protein [uncultured Photobacterium sp.]